MSDAHEVTVAVRLNGALRDLMEEDERVVLLGADIADPYGGAFKVTRGLSSEFGARVWSTPVSEGGMVGVAAGMALAGLRPIVEIMFADFVTLGFDQLFNHASKFPLMYGPGGDCPLIVRTPTGAGRGYGPTHSQCPEKFFLGVPGLAVVAAGRHLDPRSALATQLAGSGPTLWVEHKRLYGTPMATASDLRSDGWLCRDFEVGGLPARALSQVPLEDCDVVVVAYGNSVNWLEDVVSRLAIEEEVFCALVSLARLNPPDLEPLWELVRPIGRVAFVEEGPEGWSWGAELAYRAGRDCVAELRAAPLSLASRADAIPCNVWRESEVVLTPGEVVVGLRTLARRDDRAATSSRLTG